MENQVIERELETKVTTMKEQVDVIVVGTVQSYALAGEMGKGLKELRSKIVDYFAPLKDAAHKAHKAITGKESEELKPLDDAITVLRNKMNAFNEEQKRLERIEQAGLQKIADDAAEAERQRLLKAAIKAEEKGKDEKAEELLEQAEMVYTAPVTVAPMVAKTVQTASGNITQAKEVTASVVNLKLFVTALCEQNPGALASILGVKAGPLKSFIKANGLEHYPGLSISHGTSVRF
jgi:hypothetical protein